MTSSGLFSQWMLTVIVLGCWIGRCSTGYALVMRGLEGPSEVVSRGEDILLYCRYDLEEDDRLYAVKWFHGTREFYRFQPEMDPPARVFAIDHVDVDVESSDAEKLVIRQVVPATSGIYRCEVSAEETFETDYREMNITIADAPIGNPVIYNIQSSYAVGDELRINCTLYDYRPLRLYWLVNGQLKEDDEVKHYPTRRRQSSTQTSTVVGLHIKRLTGEHFSHGQMTIACAASIDSSHQSYSEAKAFMHDARQTGPLVHRLRPSTATAAAADKRRSTTSQSTGQSDSLAPGRWMLIVIILTTITT